MARYIPTNDGRHIVSTSDNGVDLTPAVISIGTAALLLQDYRRSAWTNAANGFGYVANCFNAWANSLSDAIDQATELSAAAGIADRSAA